MKINQLIIYNGIADIELDPLKENDLELILRWRNKPETSKWFFNSKPIKLCDHLYWYYSKYKLSEDDFIWVIRYKDIPVGTLSLYNIDREDKRSAEFGRLMIGNDKYKRKGIALEATKMILEYAYDVLGLKTIYLRVLKNNKPAISLYKKCGFKIIHTEDNEFVMEKENA